MRFRFPTGKARNTEGFTLVDVMGAVLVIGIAMAALVTGNGRSMTMLKSAKQAAVASKCLQQRIEQLRNYNWTEVTDAQSLQDLYGTPPLPSVELPNFSEKVTVSAFTPATTSGDAVFAPAPAAPLLVVSRAVNGTVTLDSDAPDLIDGTAVRVDVEIKWPGPQWDGTDASKRMRQTSVVISNGGVGR